jgi:hypothetical protein
MLENHSPYLRRMLSTPGRCNVLLLMSTLSRLIKLALRSAIRPTATYCSTRCKLDKVQAQVFLFGDVSWRIMR